MYHMCICNCTSCSAATGGKEGKEGADTAARKEESRREEDIPKSKRVHESHEEGESKGGYHREEGLASSDQSSTSSDEGQSSTSSEEGEDQCREWEGTYCR